MIRPIDPTELTFKIHSARPERKHICTECGSPFMSAVPNQKTCSEECKTAHEFKRRQAYDAKRSPGEMLDPGGEDHRARCLTCGVLALVGSDWLGRSTLECPTHGAMLMPIYRKINPKKRGRAA